MLYGYSWDSSNKRKGIDMESRDLFELRDVLKTSMADLKGQLKEVEDKLSDAYMSSAKDSLRNDNKDFGTAYIVDGNKRVKVNLAKKVTWDQDMLREALGTMSEENARHYGKLTFAVEERKFTAAPPAIKRILEECRTIENGRFTAELDT